MSPVSNLSSDNKQKLLILGGKPIGSTEIVSYAKTQGIYTIVADYLSVSESPAKQISDEHWEISTADLDQLYLKAREAGVTGVIAGVHEFNIAKQIELADRLKVPCYTSLELWNRCNNKGSFKEMCINAGINVAKRYSLEEIINGDDISYPLVVKPLDGSGSRGFSKCNNLDEVLSNIENAKKFSESSAILIEDYIPSDSVIIQYTISNGNILFSGISDKISKKLNEYGSPVMALQIFPSLHTKEYLEEVDEKAKKMFLDNGFKQGSIWIEAFYHNHKFIFNEMGYRFGGSLTYFPVQWWTGINQLADSVDYALNRNSDVSISTLNSANIPSELYCILPIQLNPGVISSVHGLDLIASRPDIIAVVPVHFIGDTIEPWGSAQQVFCYIHLVSPSIEELEHKIDEIKLTLDVRDLYGKNQIFTLYDETMLSKFREVNL